MARRHDELLDLGVRTVAISVDAVGQQAAMVDKLDLPFPLLSDPDRSGAIEPFGLADPHDRRDIAIPSLVLLAPGGDEVWRFVSRDYADRLPEDDIVEAARALGLAATRQPMPTPGEPSGHEGAMSREALVPYFNGARFAVTALGLRHKDDSEALKDDSKAFAALMAHYVDVLRANDVS